MKKNEKGFSSVEALLILVIVGLVACVGWYVWKQRKPAKNLTTQVQSQPKSEAKKDVQKPVAITSASVNTKPKDQLPETTLTIKEWGIKVHLRDADKITYTIDREPKENYGVVSDYLNPSFKPEFLIHKDCTPGVGLYRSKSQPSFTNQLIGGYYYWVTGGPGACSGPPETSPDDQLKLRFLADFAPGNFEQL